LKLAKGKYIVLIDADRIHFFKNNTEW
jgi:hypothetical protein